MIGRVSEELEALKEDAVEEMLREKVGEVVGNTSMGRVAGHIGSERRKKRVGGRDRSGVSTAARRKIHHTTCRTWFEKAT